MRIISIIVICVLTVFQGWCQQEDRKQIVATLEKMARAYQQASALKFNITYRYSAEASPAIYLDTLQGQFIMSAGRYWYKMDSTEGIYTNDYVILLFKDDNLMYLARPGGNQKQLPASPAVAMKSAIAGDIFLLNNENVQCSLEETADEKIITVNQPVDAVYKKMVYHINKTTGYLNKMISIVQSDQMLESPLPRQADDPITYAIVEAVYSNYTHEMPDDSLFLPGRYFRKEGDEYIAVAPYEQFTIFLGSVGL